MLNRHERRKAASFKMTTAGRQFRVSAASGTTKLHQFCRKGLARAAIHKDGSISIQFPKDAKHEWVQ